MQPCLDFKAGGVVYSDETPLYEGYGWNNNSVKLQRTSNMAAFENFISSCNIIKNGRDCSVDGIAWVAGARQRTGLGFKADGTIVVYANPYNTTIATMQKEMRAAGCVDAINLDGGASTQLSSKNHGEIYSTIGRKVQNYICIWEEPAAGSPVVSTGSGNGQPKTSAPAVWKTTPADITSFPIVVKAACNLNIRNGAASYYLLAGTYKKDEEIRVSGYASSWNKSWLKTSQGYIYRTYTQCCNPYKAPTVRIRKGSVGEGVKWMQWALGGLGYKGVNGKVLGCDGQFGTNTDYALRTFQREKEIEIDGVCGEQTVEKIKACIV